MLNKLLRYELKATARPLLLIGGGVLILTLVTGLVNFVLNSQSDLPDMVEFLQALLTFADGLALWLVAAACVFVNVQRFYKLLGEQGYLMLSLPVPAWQHIAAKLISACLWTIGCVVYLVLCVGILSGSLFGDGLTFSLINSSTVDLPVVAGILMVALLLLALLAGAYLEFYLACAIGGQFGQQRLLASIISYFVLGFLEQIILVLLLIVAAFGAVQVDAGSWMESFVQVSPEWTVIWIFLVVVLCLILVDAIKWAITQWLMTSRLNLA